jgi:hypothetical protein
VAEPDYAVVEIVASPLQVRDLVAIPNLLIEVRPMFTDDPDVVLVSALADEDAQAAARALGCTVTVEVTPAEYKAQVDAAYEGLDTDDDGGGNV